MHKSDFGKCEVPTALSKVRFQGKSGKHLLVLNSSQCDPERKLQARRRLPEAGFMVSPRCLLRAQHSLEGVLAPTADEPSISSTNIQLRRVRPAAIGRTTEHPATQLKKVYGNLNRAQSCWLAGQA
jgi:hypothetical protein